MVFHKKHSCRTHTPQEHKAYIGWFLVEIVMEKKNNSRTINILSAGCATGEEPYTIAMILKELIEDINNWQINLTATDINEKALEIAEEMAGTKLIQDYRKGSAEKPGLMVRMLRRMFSS